VPEVIVCRHTGIRALGISIITDMCLPDALHPVSLPEILATAKAAEEKLRLLVRKVVEKIKV
jgi:purine-nucleoside phosphorylase